MFKTLLSTTNNAPWTCGYAAALAASISAAFMVSGGWASGLGPGVGRLGSQSPPPQVGPLDASAPIGFYIASGTVEVGYRAGDEVLARWALQAWQEAANEALELHAAAEDSALIRLYWAPAQRGLYGTMRRIWVDDKRGAVVFVLPDTRGLGPEIAARAQQDPLFRDVVVYLTCLHELGHGFGLTHTAEYDDIMYFFGYGGDIPNVFQRYRDQLTKRDDIPKHPGLSERDTRRLQALYPTAAGP